MKLDCKKLVKMGQDKYKCPDIIDFEMNKKQAEILCKDCILYTVA